ncbi:MAG: amidohydrolase [Clostridia bacterium]|nr:amidohydrolase [Clostridia bacterium]
MRYTNSDYIIAIRRELHRVPELGYDLPKTTEIVKRELTRIGINYTEEYGDSSIVCVINPEKKFTIALRADMDALPVEEKTGLEFSSEHPGKMHACGHDAHTACLLGAAEALHNMREKLECRVKLIFQPNEEGVDSAADLLCKRGVLDGVDVILGLHVDNTVKSGCIGICPGASMASCRNFEIEFFGKTAHAASSHTGADALAAAVTAYNDIQLMLARQIDPKKPRVCSIGALHSGDAQNVVADHSIMRGTIRTYETELDAEIYDKIKKISENSAENMGCTYKITSSEFLPPVYNDTKICELLKKSASSITGEENVVEIAPKMSSEDFADYLTRVPGVLFRIGTADPNSETQTSAHNNDFLIDESGLSLGADTFVQFILDYGGKI